MGECYNDYIMAHSRSPEKIFLNNNNYGMIVYIALNSLAWELVN